MLICRNAKAPSKLALVKLVENSLYLTHPWTVQLNWGEDLSSFCQCSYRYLVGRGPESHGVPETSKDHVK